MAIRFLLVESVYNYPPGENSQPALGLAYIAGALRHEFGDMIEFKIIKDNLTDEIVIFKPDVVGITSVTKNYNVAKEHAEIAKQVFGLPVIIGGVHISLMPQTLTHDMDVGVVGEGERTIVDLIASFIKNNGFDSTELNCIKGIMYWDEGKVKVTESRALIKPIDDIPYPARDLIVVDKHTNMVSSRGCPYNCAFCSTSRYTGNQARYASVQHVVDEIELLYEQYGVEYITFCDDLFALNSNRVRDIADLLRYKGLSGKIEFAISIRTDFVTDELAVQLKKMNVAAVGLGVESGCQKTLDYLKSGGITVEDNSKAIRLLRKHKIRQYCSIIIGSPYEDKADLMQTVDFIIDNKVTDFQIAVLAPFPGTPVWEYAKGRGLVDDDMDWGKLSFFNINEAVILSEKVSHSELLSVFEILVRRKHRYLTKRRILKVIKHPDIYIGAYIKAYYNAYYNGFLKGLLNRLKGAICH